MTDPLEPLSAAWLADVRREHRRAEVATPDDHVDVICGRCYIFDEGWPCADEAGRRAAAVIGFRWWITKGTPSDFPVAVERPDAEGGAFEYSDGTIRSVASLSTGLGLFMFLKEPLTLPNCPDLTPLAGRDLACWCPLDQPCHADALLELANA